LILVKSLELLGKTEILEEIRETRTMSKKNRFKTEKKEKNWS